MLTELKLKNIKPTDKIKLYSDGDGLYLRVSKTKKRWQLSFMKDGNLRHFYSDKEYPLMSLKDARDWAAETRALAEQNEVGSMSEVSFKHFADLFKKRQIANGRAAATLKKVDMRLNKYLAEFFDRDIRSITPQDILKRLRTIEAQGKMEALRQTLQLTNNIFLMAKIEGVRSDNPAEGLGKALASKPRTSRAAIVDVYEFGELLQAIDGSNASLSVKSALQLSALVFTRPVELRDAVWTEFDFENDLWEIPKERMKMENELIVPLSRQAKKVFLTLKKQAHSNFVFAMPNETDPYSDVTIRKELLNLGYYGAHQKDVPKDAQYHSPHGFRASFRTIADEILEWRVDVLEHQLAHIVRDTNGVAYNRTKHLEKRIQMMQLWADFLDILKAGNKKEIKAWIQKHKGII